MSNRGLFWWLPFGNVDEVDSEELRNLLDSNQPPRLLDVRTQREWVGGHIEGSVNIPILEFGRRLGELGQPDGRAVVAICRSAHRSPPAVRALRAAGFSGACQLKGGMKAWRASGLPTETPPAP